MATLRLAVALLCCAATAEPQPRESGSATPASPPAIQDNSFLLEEAYNQEPGVVQHVNLFLRDVKSGEWLAAFTQEYPVPGIAHQFSYTVPYLRTEGEAGKFSGLGDIALNYRYQLIGSGETRVAATPRLTVFLPTGNPRRGPGAGSTGVQLGLAISVLAATDWVAHGNAGVTFTPSARDVSGNKADTAGGYAGGSVIWLGGGRWNGMLEALWTRNQVVVGPEQTRIESTLTLNPGVRWAFDFRSGLQVVPGISVPIGVGPSRGQYGVLLYLSLEHPMWSARER